MRRLLLAALPLLAMPAGAPAQPRPGVESISFQVGPCFGACAGFSFTVQADGTGLFEGVSGSALPGRHPFRITRAQYQAFSRHLAPVRPARGNVSFTGPDQCRGIITDQMHTVVTWRPARGPGQELNFYHGCIEPRVAGIDRRLAGAPGLLPLARFIRARPNRRR
ncbi:MAG TPA: DUF6438 domain-containing protein [Allosphingosinicella sp.]|jgi:hypothetical protein|nr:DUF6438 domain-containing protein [Allosphingosinicella sp.]